MRRALALCAVVATAFAAAAHGAVAPAQHGSFPACKQGYYKNVSGHCVRRPHTSATVPAGATARCRDGSYSFSEHASGTCSHHGGVAVWIHHP